MRFINVDIFKRIKKKDMHDDFSSSKIDIDKKNNTCITVNFHTNDNIT